MDQLQQWWDNLRPGTQENIVGGIVGGIALAFILACVAVLRKSIGAAWRRLTGKPSQTTDASLAPATPTPPTPAIQPILPIPSTPSEEELALRAERDALQRVIEERFSPEELITDICAPLGIRPENVLTGDTHKLKVFNLLGYCVRKNLLVNLRRAVETAIPGVQSTEQKLLRANVPDTTQNRKLDIKQEETFIIHRLGETYASLGDSTLALENLRHALNAYKSSNDSISQYRCLKQIGDLCMSQGNASLARDAYEEALKLLRSL